MRISDWSSDVCSSDLFDWLSRDAAEVDKYIADPLCGFPITVQAWIDFLDGLEAMARPENQARIPKAMPVLVIAGSLDPVSGGTRGLRQLLEIGRASCRERVCKYVLISVVAVSLKKKIYKI